MRRWSLALLIISIILPVTACTTMETNSSMNTLQKSKADTHAVVARVRHLLPAEGRIEEFVMADYGSSCTGEADGPQLWEHDVDFIYERSTDTMELARRVIEELTDREWRVRSDLTTDKSVNVFLVRETTLPYSSASLHVTSARAFGESGPSVGVSAAGPCITLDSSGK